MILVAKTYWTGMPFWFRKNPEDASSESLVLRAHDLHQLRAVCWSSRVHPKPKVGVVLMHPRIDFTHHYAIPRLLDAGFCVLGAMNRGGGSDLYVEHEEMLLDVAACVRFLKEKRNVERVVLLGNSGGGSLLAYYQAEARAAPAERTKESPAGNPTRFDSAPMTPADLMVYVAAHRGQGQVLLDCIDPSVTDERDPVSVDASLDLYDERNGFREPPEPSRYTPEFLERFRAAQAARVERIDGVARALIEGQRTAATEMSAPGFDVQPAAHRREVARRRVTDPILTVYRTMANPSYVDPGVDPSPRDYGSLLSDRPDLMNYASLGFARVCTARSWLSTWSGRSSKADLCANVARIQEPTLVVHAARDREVLPADARRIFDAVASKDRTFREVRARHYFEPEPGSAEPGDVNTMMDIVIPWIHERVS